MTFKHVYLSDEDQEVLLRMLDHYLSTEELPLIDNMRLNNIRHRLVTEEPEATVVLRCK